MFTAEKFDADQWAEIFHNAGARFAGPVAEHHDGFSMWDTATSRWNAAQMGLKRDIVAALEKAYRAKGMKYMVAMHHAEHWWFFPHWLKVSTSPTRASRSSMARPHNTRSGDPARGVGPRGRMAHAGPAEQGVPARSGASALHEVVDRFQPDYIWFDFGLRYIQEQYKKDFLAYYYNKGLEWDREVAGHLQVVGPCPRRRRSSISNSAAWPTRPISSWITDTTVDDGQAWGLHEECPLQVGDRHCRSTSSITSRRTATCC